jgi:hypothetical protein
MPGLKKYDAVVNGARTTFNLTEADAKKRGLTETKQKAPANKGRGAANKTRGASTPAASTSGAQTPPADAGAQTPPAGSTPNA